MTVTSRKGNPIPLSKLDPKFGQWLRGSRLGVPLSLQEFARAAGLSESTVREFELGHRNEGSFYVEVFVRFAEALGMELGYVLHKAGFPVARDGVDLNRLGRVEAVTEQFAAQESQLRFAISEAIHFADRPGQGNDELILALGRGLAALDRVTERMRREGFIAHLTPNEREAATEVRATRPWTAAEVAFLRQHPHLSNEDAAAQLSRTPNSVRAHRRRLQVQGEAA